MGHCAITSVVLYILQGVEAQLEPVVKGGKQQQVQRPEQDEKPGPREQRHRRACLPNTPMVVYLFGLFLFDE